MAELNKMKFSPEDGWHDTATFPNKQNESRNREMMNELPFQLRDFINTLIVQLQSTEEIGGTDFIGAYKIEGLLNEDGTEAITANEQIKALKCIADGKLSLSNVKGGTGIRITYDESTNELSIVATGEALPANHAAEHEKDGEDAIDAANLKYGETTLADMMRKLEVSAFFIGTTEQFEALSEEEQLKVELFFNTSKQVIYTKAKGETYDLFVDFNSIKSKDIEITSDMWVFDEAENLYKATIEWNGITVNHKVDMNFDIPSLELASDVINYTNTSENCFFLYSSSAIADTLTGVAYAKVVTS